MNRKTTAASKNPTAASKKPQAERKNKGVRYELYFPPDMDKELRETKERTGNPVASFIRSAVREKLDREQV